MFRLFEAIQKREIFQSNRDLLRWHGNAMRSNLVSDRFHQSKLSLNVRYVLMAHCNYYLAVMGADKSLTCFDLRHQAAVWTLNLAELSDDILNFDLGRLLVDNSGMIVLATSKSVREEHQPSSTRKINIYIFNDGKLLRNMTDNGSSVCFKSMCVMNGCFYFHKESPASPDERHANKSHQLIKYDAATDKVLIIPLESEFKDMNVAEAFCNADHYVVGVYAGDLKKDRKLNHYICFMLDLSADKLKGINIPLRSRESLLSLHLQNDYIFYRLYDYEMTQNLRSKINIIDLCNPGIKLEFDPAIVRGLVGERTHSHIIANDEYIFFLQTLDQNTQQNRYKFHFGFIRRDDSSTHTLQQINFIDLTMIGDIKAAISGDILTVCYPGERFNHAAGRQYDVHRSVFDLKTAKLIHEVVYRSNDNNTAYFSFDENKLVIPVNTREGAQFFIEDYCEVTPENMFTDKAASARRFTRSY